MIQSQKKLQVDKFKHNEIWHIYNKSSFENIITKLNLLESWCRPCLLNTKFKYNEVFDSKFLPIITTPPTWDNVAGTLREWSLSAEQSQIVKMEKTFWRMQRKKRITEGGLLPEKEEFYTENSKSLR